MKKITLLMLIVTSFSTLCFSQNLVTNPGFEADVTTFTVVESSANVLYRVDAIAATTTQASNPTATAMSVPAGMWVKKASNSGYVKGVVITTDAKTGTSSLNLKITSNSSQTGLNLWYNCVTIQKLSIPLNNNKKYRASVWARLDDTTPNASVNIYLFLTDNTAKVNITKTIPLNGGTTWTKYDTTFDLPAHITTNPTADFATAFFGAGMTTTYDGASKTNYSGLIIDDFTLEEDVSTAINETSVVPQTLIASNNGLTALKTGQLTIYSLSGSKISQKNVQANENITLPRGMFVVQLIAADGIFTQKVNF